MTFQKPKHTNPAKPLTENKGKEILGLIADAANKQQEKAVKVTERVDTNLSRYLTATLSYYYFMLSITTASIGFTISFTIHERFSISDCFILISLIIWIVAFNKGLHCVNRINDMMFNFSFHLLGEAYSNKEISETYKKISNDIAAENSKLKNSPVFYFVIGVLSFLIWYIIKIFTNK